MDANGAKALQRRLGANRSPDQQTLPAAVSQAAPPLYHWFGVEPTSLERWTTAEVEPSVSDPPRVRGLGRFSLRHR
jgi:hypothetical protein